MFGYVVLVRFSFSLFFYILPHQIGVCCSIAQFGAHGSTFVKIKSCVFLSSCVELVIR